MYKNTSVSATEVFFMKFKEMDLFAYRKKKPGDYKPLTAATLAVNERRFLKKKKDRSKEEDERL